MKRILVVDDSGTIRKAIRRILEAMEYAVHEAADGEAALAALEAGESFEAVVCDIDMPVMDGLAFLAAVQARPQLSAPPIIMCTTHISFDKIQTALTLGASEYIMKPFDATIIASKLETVGVQ